MLFNPSEPPIELGRFEHGIVRRKVRQLIGTHGFQPQDRKSLEQELLTRVVQGLRSFDPGQSHRNIFVTTIVERSVATIIRDRYAEKRDHRRISSLHELVPGTDGGLTEIGETLGQESYDARRGRQPRSAQEICELSCDVAQCLASLPSELRQIAEALKHKSVSELARELGIPRTTLRERVMHIRNHFEAAGMRLHL
jgi:RNA polymerase sigma-70 factor, ECF subfamily